MTSTDQLALLFEQHFGYPHQAVFSAPGRVNLIGEHTDYNDGFVLPCAINFSTVILAGKRKDTRVRVIAADYDGQSDEFSIGEDVSHNHQQMWSNYVRGVVKHLHMHQHLNHGMDIIISGNVPQGAGLSSSASLEVAVGYTLAQLNEIDLSPSRIALIGQEAENQFVGCNCGIMDQMISANGQEGHAMLLDCRSLDTKLVPIPDDLSVMIINSNVKRGLVDSEYNIRRKQCEEAASVMKVDALRDASMQQLEFARDQLSDEVYRRARHVITENQRTLDASDALATSDYGRLSSLMAESHASMRDDFNITVKEIDYIVELMADLIGPRGGVRMTGGGFGGCVVALLPESLVEPAKALLAEKYQAETQFCETVYICHASGGVTRLT